MRAKGHNALLKLKVI